MADPENTVIIELKDGGIVEIEMLPDVAPRHVERIKSLARAGNADTRREVRAAEDSVAELERTLDGGGDPIAAVDVDGGAAPAVGGNIDVSV